MLSDLSSLDSLLENTPGYFSITLQEKILILYMKLVIPVSDIQFYNLISSVCFFKFLFADVMQIHLP